MSLKCYFQFDSGRFCKKFAMTGSRFCNNHQPQGLDGPGAFSSDGWPSLHPHVRLATPNDLFDLVRETLLGTRTGAVTPSQAFAIGSLANVWLRVYEEMVSHQRLHALTHQILPTLVDAESTAQAERENQLAADAARRAEEDPAPLAPHDPWAAGRMAGPVPTAPSEISNFRSEIANPVRSSRDPTGLGPVPVPSNGATVDLAAAQAELEALVAARTGDPSPPSTAAASKPNGRGR